MLKFWLSRSDETGQAYHEISFPKDSNLTQWESTKKDLTEPLANKLSDSISEPWELA